MNRRETVFIKRRQPDPLPFEPVNPPHWAEMLGLILLSLIVGIAFALNVPEAPSEGAICGLDRDAPTLNAGCKP